MATNKSRTQEGQITNRMLTEFHSGAASDSCSVMLRHEASHGNTAKDASFLSMTGPGSS